MLSNSSWLITFIFKVLNVGFLVASIVYIVKAYYWETLKKGVTEHQITVDQLQSEYDKLTAHGVKIEQDIEEQQHYGNELIENLEQWNTAEKKKYDAIKNSLIHQEQVLMDKRRKQVLFYITSKTEREVFEDALQEVEMDLKQYFLDPSHYEPFVATIVDTLKHHTEK